MPADPNLPVPEPAAAGTATFAPFRFPAFRAIWLANLASSIGSTVQSVAAAWLMTELTDSHQLVALVQASTTIPIMLLGVFAGAIADNYDRRRVMLAAQAGMLVVSALLALLAWRGDLTPVSLLLFTLAVGSGTALNAPAWQASVRMQVDAAHLPQAISLNTIAFNLARSVGPALGGLLISLWSPALAFALNAVSYLAMIIVLLRWHPQVTPPQRQAMLASIRTGAAYCLASRPLSRILLRGFAFGLGGAGYHALIPNIARDRIGGSEIDFGLILGAFGIGSILAALRVSAVRRRFGSEAVLSAATIVFAAALVPLALTHALPVALASAFIAGAGWVAAMTSLNVAMQLRSPEAILGRCLSLYQAVTFGGLALGSYALGLLADLTSLPVAVLTAAGFLLLSLAVLRRLAPMPTRDEGRL